MHFFPAARLLWRVFFVYLCAMKQMLTIGFLVLLALAACNPSAEVTEHGRSEEGPNPELSAIDSLMWRQPDSALAVLQQFAASSEADSLDELNGHYCQLLISELLYKNDYGQSNRPALQQAVRYFDSLCLCKGVVRNVSTIAFLDARAHYINGVGYYERDSVVEACKEYLKALEVMENHFEEKDLVGKKARFMALSYTRLTILFADHYLHNQAIFFAQNSIPYYKTQTHDVWNLAWVLNQIGMLYDVKNQLDSANYYYGKATEFMNDTSISLYRDIATHQVYLKYRIYKQFDEAIERMYVLLSKSESHKEKMARSLIIGDIFYHEKDFDSSWHYLNRVFNESSDISLKKQAAEWLAGICKTQDKDKEVIEYVEFLASFATQDENNSIVKSQLTEMSNCFLQTRLERQHQMAMRRNTKTAGGVISAISIMLLIVIVLYYIRKKQGHNLKAIIEENRYIFEIRQKALLGRLKHSNELLKEIKNKEKDASSFQSKPQQQKQAISYEKEPICQHILLVCSDKSNPIKTSIPVSSYAKIALNDEQKAQLKTVAHIHYGSLFAKLKIQYPDLKERDLLYCYLCLLGLDNSQIAALTQLSYRTIWQREKRLQGLFHKEDRIAIILHEL